jgi:hypothetical protein
MTSVNTDYYAMMRRWWQFTETRLDFYDNKLKAYQDRVYEMRAYHARKDSEQERIYEYQQGQLKIYAQPRGQKVDVYA